MNFRNVFQFLFSEPPKAQEPLPEPASEEQAWYEQSFFGSNSGKFEKYNPDVLVRARGHEVYSQMLKDPQVKAGYHLITDLIVSRDWRFRRVDDSEQQRKIQEFFRFQIERALVGSFKDALKTVLRAKAQGYSISEKAYHTVNWEGSPKWFLRALRWRPYHTFRFQIDPYGNVLKIIQDANGEKKSFDPRLFVYFVNNPDSDPLHGESDLSAAYKPYWEKDVISKMWNIYLERMAAGFLAATPNRPLQAPERAELRKVLENVSALTAMTLPPGVEVEMVHAPSTEAFEKAIHHKNQEIAKSLLVPNLLGFSEQSNTGSFAQSRTQQETFFLAVTRQGDSLADAMNEQVFKELSYWNFGKDVLAPIFEFDPLTDEQKRAFVKSWTEAVREGAVVNTHRDEIRTRELLGYDERAEDEKPLEVTPPTLNVPDDGGEEGGSAGEDERPLREKRRTASYDPSRSGRFAEPGTVSPDERINFVNLAAELDGLEEESTMRITKVLRAMTDEAATVVRAKDTFDPNDTKIVERAITAESKRQLNKAWRVALSRGYDRGRAVSITALRRAGLRPEDSDRLAVEGQRISNSQGEPKKFADGVIPMAAEDYFAARAFWLTGNMTQEIIAAAQLVLVNGIRDSMTTAEMMAALEPLLAPYLGGIDAGGRQINLGHRLETIVRTNLTDAFVQAQLSVFRDPALGDFVTAMRYSAIIDSRTTDFCRSYHGKTFAASDPIWDRITPPNHFNCRSLLIPLLQDDDFRLSSPLAIDPALGFTKLEEASTLPD